MLQHNWRWFSLGILILLGIIGWFNTPVSLEGRPSLLLPEIKKIEDYRHQAARWIKQLSLLDGQIEVLLSGNQVDPLTVSRKSQDVYSDCLRLLQVVDATTVPYALAGVHQGILEIIQAYLDATQALLDWVGDPNEESLVIALDGLVSAKQLLAALEGNPWMQRSGFSGSR